MPEKCSPERIAAVLQHRKRLAESFSGMDSLQFRSCIAMWLADLYDLVVDHDQQLESLDLPLC
jgi:hypothetical protein